MISPFVRRRRLATELIALREAHGVSAARLATDIGVARQRVSRLENGHVAPDLDEIMRILELFQVNEQRWQQIMTIAREAQERGWWAKFAGEMGARQALYANLEAGASQIREYQMVYLPGLLQTPSYTECRISMDRTEDATYNLSRASEARAGRQRMVERPGGPIYEVIIDELAVRRFAAPPPIVADQLDHIVRAGHEREALVVRVLPLGAPISNHSVPRSAFFMYRYPDPEDPIVVAVDTVTDDLVLTQPPSVDRYVQLYDLLVEAALRPDDSLDFLATVAEETRRMGTMDKLAFGEWRKSTRSGGADNCAEAAISDDRYVGLRDSKDPKGPNLVFSQHVWAEFVEGIRRGEFDR